MNSFRVLFVSFLAVFIMVGSIAADDFLCPFPTVIRCKDKSYEFSYASDNPEEIHRNNSAIIKAVGGKPPYIWSVSGKGFSLGGLSRTNDPFNSIVADSSACGSADILISDQCRGISGSIRCPDGGSWVEIKPSICKIAGAATSEVWSSGTKVDQTRIKGKYKQTQLFIAEPWCLGVAPANNDGLANCQKSYVAYLQRALDGECNCGRDYYLGVTGCQECIDIPLNKIEPYKYVGGQWVLGSPCTMYSNSYQFGIACGSIRDLKLYEWKCQ